MADMLRIEDLDKLVLVWLAVPRKSPSLKSLQGALAPFVKDTGAAPDSVARQILARLKARGDIAADTTWMLSPSGNEKALSALGLQSLPKRPSWKWVYNLLTARGTGAEPTPAALRRVGAAENLYAAVLQTQLRIQNPAVATASQIANAIAWRELGVESTAPFSRKAVLAHVTQKLRPGTKAPKSSDEALRLLAAAELHVPATATAIRGALVQRWIDATHDAAATNRAAPTTATPPLSIEPADVHPSHVAQPAGGRPIAAPDDPAALRVFAEQAMTAVRTSSTGRWGDHKVFVSHVWDEFQRRDRDATMDFDTFKRLLVRANQAGLLSLSRADLVEAMNAEDVRRSEIASLGATFHFVRTD